MTFEINRINEQLRIVEESSSRTFLIFIRFVGMDYWYEGFSLGHFFGKRCYGLDTKVNHASKASTRSFLGCFFFPFVSTPSGLGQSS